jgi:hypothetical protein
VIAIEPNCRSQPLRSIATIIFLLLAALRPAFGGEPRVSFTNDVVPVLTKAGCNAGTCHAKAGNGQNGFQLSLFGYEPSEDFEHIVNEARGRRISTTAPEQSLLLMKGVGRVPHGGGVRLQPGSEAYALVRDWITAGARNDVKSAPALTSLRIDPPQLSLLRNTKRQLRVTATYSDGSTRDVTRPAVYESNDRAMAEVTEHGLVGVLEIAGNVAVMARYQGHVAVSSIAVPHGDALDKVPAARNFIDEHVFANLKRLGIQPSPVCDDATFLRRVSLDIAGRLPTEAEAEAFHGDRSPDKRDKLIEKLLRSPGYADFFAGKWTTLLKNRRENTGDIVANFAFHAWVRDSLLANKPYDQFVRELLAATGTIVGNPPVAWYKRVKEPKQQIEDVAQLFLGVRMQCAQCHHHPFERWSQDDYYALAAFFSQVGRKPAQTRDEDLIFHKRGVAAATNMKTGVALKPAAFGDAMAEIAPDEDPRLRLADWMSARENRFFAKALVNRYWKHFFQRGLIEPEDDIRDTNPPTNPELLAALEKHFTASGFDLKDLVRVIVRSHAYQLSAQTNPSNIADRQNYSRYYPRRMQAEVLLDSIDGLTGAQTNFADLPAGTRAVALPDSSYNRSTPFLKVFGRPEAESVCECERVQSSSLAQSLYLINAADIKGKLTAGGGRAQKLVDAKVSGEAKIRELYLAAFAREPRSSELKTALTYLAEVPPDPTGAARDPRQVERENLQDLIWALINTKEFQFNH